MNADLLFSSEGDLWRTPAALLDWLAPFKFSLDAAAADDRVAGSFLDAEQDALKMPWNGRVWCNPPYSHGAAFVQKALDEYRSNPRCDGICLLMPARTDTKWFHDEFGDWNRVWFLKGRLKFWLAPWELELVNSARALKDKKPLGPENSAPFPSVLLLAGFGLYGRATQCVDWRREALGTYYPPALGTLEPLQSAATIPAAA